MSPLNVTPPPDVGPATAARTEKETYDPNTGNIIERTVEESYWQEIIFGFFGLAIVVIAVFVGLGNLEINALQATIGAVGSVFGIAVVSKKKRKGKNWTLLIIAVIAVCFVALVASLVALYFSLQ